jgi:GxxExxY protein
MSDFSENELSQLIINRAIELHKQLGPGLLTSVYHECLFYELIKKGLRAESNKVMALSYKEVDLESAYKIDLIVNEKVIILIKHSDNISDHDVAQALTYLKLSAYKLALIINFNTHLLKHGIKRVINGYLD